MLSLREQHWCLRKPGAEYAAHCTSHELKVRQWKRRGRLKTRCRSHRCNGDLGGDFRRGGIVDAGRWLEVDE